MSRFVKHVFVCTHERNDGRQFCGQQSGLDIIRQLKKLVRDHNLSDKIRINRSGCLDACSFGHSMVIYPEAFWYGHVDKTNLIDIFEHSILHNKPFKPLQIIF